MKNKRNLNYIIICIILMSFMSFGCATSKPQSTETKIYKVLKTAADIYESGMSAMGDLYAQGKITEQEKDKIVDLGNIFWSAYHSASASFDIWSRSKTADNKIALDKMLTELASSMDDFQQYVLPLYDKIRTPKSE